MSGACTCASPHPGGCPACGPDTPPPQPPAITLTPEEFDELVRRVVRAELAARNVKR